MKTEKFTVSGMTCSACSAGIERTVKKLNGVETAEVFLMSESMNVTFDENKLSTLEIINAVVSLGYGAEIFDERKEKTKKDKSNALKKRFFISLFFLIPLMYFSMGGMISLPQPSEKISYTLQALLTFIIVCVN
ncbi:MAG: cation-translocating P-type ATPase, partial [Clostridia bacterium]|nr:cation-translocating P-type ATPase [Clostridia bacterium]